MNTLPVYDVVVDLDFYTSDKISIDQTKNVFSHSSKNLRINKNNTDDKIDEKIFLHKKRNLDDKTLYSTKKYHLQGKYQKKTECMVMIDSKNYQNLNKEEITRESITQNLHKQKNLIESINRTTINNYTQIQDNMKKETIPINLEEASEKNNSPVMKLINIDSTIDDKSLNENPLIQKIEIQNVSSFCIYKDFQHISSICDQIIESDYKNRFQKVESNIEKILLEINNKPKIEPNNILIKLFGASMKLITKIDQTLNDKLVSKDEKLTKQANYYSNEILNKEKYIYLEKEV